MVGAFWLLLGEGSQSNQAARRGALMPSWRTQVTRKPRAAIRIRRMSAVVMAEIMLSLRSCHQWQKSRRALIYCHRGGTVVR